jgi:hypothetical protein
MAQEYRKLMGKDAAPQQKTLDDYLQWANLVLRTAALLLPYQRPTYRSIEVHTDKGIEERVTRFNGDPAERLAQNLVLRTAALLLPYQRPTYRSIEVHTDKGIEERVTRFNGDPAERLAQIVVGAIIAQSDATAPVKKDAEAPNSPSDAAAAPAEPVDNGDGVIS